jgi:hypothetical protein
MEHLVCAEVEQRGVINLEHRLENAELAKVEETRGAVPSF